MKYETPYIEIVMFENEDIITDSSTIPTDENETETQPL